MINSTTVEGDVLPARWRRGWEHGYRGRACERESCGQKRTRICATRAASKSEAVSKSKTVVVGIYIPDG